MNQARAKGVVARAIQDGTLVQSDRCATCKTTARTEGHHRNGYKNPLDVVWLCRSCHRAEHHAGKPTMGPASRSSIYVSVLPVTVRFRSYQGARIRELSRMLNMTNPDVVRLAVDYYIAALDAADAA